MTMTVLRRPEADSRREDFPVESFRHLEAKLQEIRRAVMQGAAQIAVETTDRGRDVYRIERDHIDQALKNFLLDVEAAMERLGFNSVSIRANPPQPSSKET